MGLIRPLTSGECVETMAQLGFGRMAMLTDRGPYAVPMLFLTSAEALNFYTLPGRKLEALRNHPRGVVVEFDDVDRTDAWHSVLAVGYFVEIPASEIRTRLAEELIRRKGRFATIARDQVNEPSAVFGRIVVEQLSGRAYV